MTVPIYKGRKVNKVLCLSFLLVTMILFMTAGIFAFLKKSAVCDTFCILALISGAFSLLYGTLWLIYGLKEKKTERELSEFFGRQNLPVDPARPDYREFFLPEERLKGMSRKRFRSVLRWTGFAALAAFLLICGIQLAVGSLASPLQVLFIFLFCALITIPGILVQLYLFLKYDCSVPSRILLFPGKLIVDDTVFLAGEILIGRAGLPPINHSGKNTSNSLPLFPPGAQKTLCRLSSCTWPDLISARACYGGFCSAPDSKMNREGSFKGDLFDLRRQDG